MQKGRWEVLKRRSFWCPKEIILFAFLPMGPKVPAKRAQLWGSPTQVHFCGRSRQESAGTVQTALCISLRDLTLLLLNFTPSLLDTASFHFQPQLQHNII